MKVVKKSVTVRESISDAKDAIQGQKRKFENFEKNEFEGKMSDIKKQNKNCVNKVNEIDEQHEEAVRTLGKAKEALNSCTASTSGQKSKLSSLRADISLVEKRLKQSIKNLDVERKCLKDLG